MRLVLMSIALTLVVIFSLGLLNVLTAFLSVFSPPSSSLSSSASSSSSSSSPSSGSSSINIPTQVDHVVHARKILFNSHTHDTLEIPDIHDRVHRWGVAKLKNALFGSESVSSSSSSRDDESSEFTWLMNVSPSSYSAESLAHALGIDITMYLPHNTFVFVSNKSIAIHASQLPYVEWVGDYPDKAKISHQDIRQLLLETRIEDQLYTRMHSNTNSNNNNSSNDNNNINNNNSRIILHIQLNPKQRTYEEISILLQSIINDYMSTNTNNDKYTCIEPIHRHISASPSLPQSIRIWFSYDILVFCMQTFIRRLIAHADIYSIEFLQQQQKHNYYASILTQDGIAPPAGKTPIWSANLHGENQIIGSADSGLDWDHCYFYDPKYPQGVYDRVHLDARKLIFYEAISDQIDDVNGHGTHTQGSIAGNPAPFISSASSSNNDQNSIYNHMGMAPEAKLYFQDVEKTGGQGLDGLDVIDLKDLFQHAYDAGARIHSNSWGASKNVYDSMAQAVDQFVWDHKDMMILFAAGNDGLRDGSPSGTVGSPATAKNILSVGASQTTTQGWIDSLNYIPWDQQSSEAASVLQKDPKTFDCCSQSNSKILEYCCKSYVLDSIQTSPQTHNQEDMADFSSRGPTYDGRVKPEVVAPGDYIVSSKSDGKITTSQNTQCSGSSPNALLAMAGTSMATPVTAGSAALVRQYLTEGWYPTGAKSATATSTPIGSKSPSAALIAAMLMGSARSLTGEIDVDNNGQSYTSLANGTYPFKVFQGFGKIELDNALYFQGNTGFNLWMTDSNTLSTGQENDYCFSVTGNAPMKVNLVWHDYPAQTNAALAAVNDLDLIAGTSSSNALAGNFVNKRDARNNMEHVLDYGVKGGDTFYIKVRATNVPMGGSQPYALVVIGQFDPNSLKTQCAFNVQSFPEASESDYFPYGPVIGGAVGGVVGLSILGLILRYLYAKYLQPVLQPILGNLPAANSA